MAGSRQEEHWGATHVTRVGFLEKAQCVFEFFSELLGRSLTAQYVRVFAKLRARLGAEG